jgi:hypothetical protein
MKSSTHVDACPPLGYKRRKCMFVQHWLHRIISDQLSIYLTISLVRLLYACACQLMRRSVNNIELLSLSLSLSHSILCITYNETHQRRHECTKIRDQVAACVCLVCFFTHNTHIAQLPKGNLSI